jgi:hypothetical protein
LDYPLRGNDIKVCTNLGPVPINSAQAPAVFTGNVKSMPFDLRLVSPLRQNNKNLAETMALSYLISLVLPAKIIRNPY